MTEEVTPEEELEALFTQDSGLRAYRCRLEPDERQNVWLFGFADARRWVWNECVAWAAEANFAAKAAGAKWPSGDAFTLAFLGKLLNQWQEENPWLRSVPKQSLQQALIDFIRARKAFLSGAAIHPPQFQKVKRAISTVRFPQSVKRNQDSVFLPKLGWVKYRNSFNHGRGVPPGEMRSATVKFENGRWFVTLLMKREPDEATQTPAATVGVDCGVENTLALSFRRNLQAPLMTVEDEKRLHFLERRVARCEPGSFRHRAAVLRLNKFRSRITRRIQNWRHCVTTDLSKNHGLIAVEDLALKNMTASARGTVEAPGSNVAQKAGLNRSMLEPGFGEIIRQLEYKQARTGRTCVRVSPAFTSQTCPNPDCGCVSPDNRPTRGRFKCVKCGFEDEADFVAARNILRRGINLFNMAAGLGRDCSTVDGHQGLRNPVPENQTQPLQPRQAKGIPAL